MKTTTILTRNALLAMSLSGVSFGATVINFSDSVNIISSPPSIILDTLPYANTVIGVEWLVFTSSTTITNLDISHHIFLFGSGALNTVRVFGSAQSVVSLVANPGSPFEQTFLGSPGPTASEYIFDMSDYNFQPSVTTISGFSTISTINFVGAYTLIPEPSGMILSGMATISLLLRRRRN